ncbi:hypothetical protein BGX26_009949 [Mortierella sp. AD094]|nr:hypothetical protein BGX26_009949 [Mortierella sp. AD094]
MSKEFPGKIEFHQESEHVVDHNISFSSVEGVALEEILHYAKIQRAREAVEDGLDIDGNDINPFGRYANRRLPLAAVTREQLDEKHLSPHQTELSNARRALRQAGWAAIFFLITTDILGPFNAPIAIAQLGYVPGISLYTVMGFFAFYCGLILWRLYVHFDSDEYPCKTYSDVCERIFGRAARHICTVLQSLQLIVNVGVICLANGQSLAQIVAGPNNTGSMCFAVAIVVWAILGMVLGQIRSLKNFSYLSYGAVFLNLLLIVTSMGFMAHSPPNYIAAALIGVAKGDGIVHTQLVVSNEVVTKINGMMQMVFAYGGAMIFPELMAEMRRPMDFWKGMACAQTLIFVVYLMYGVFVYALQGQYTLPLAYQGVSQYSFQTFGNILALITGIIAGALYGNIGIKVAYINIVEDWLKGPSLMSRKGHIIWVGMVVSYWGLAYIVGSAIPQVENISSLIAAICILQFSYTFPPILRFAYDVLTDAMSEDAVFVPGHGTSGRIDTWNDRSRWMRGLFTGRVWFKAFNLILFIGFSVWAVLGMWGSGVSIQQAFQTSGAATSFGCTAPV